MGGHGYSAASAVGLFPPVSLAGQVPAAGDGPHGGPTVPCTTLKTVDTVPVAEVVTRALNDGAVQLTEIKLLTRPPTNTFGWLASLLHSSTLPSEFLANPEPVIVTDEPLARPVLGVTEKVVAANADIVVPSRTDPATTRAAARTMMTLARASRTPDSTAVTLVRPNPITTHPPR